MAATVVDNVKIKVLSTGTGALQLGSSVDGYRGQEALTNGKIYNYAVRVGGIYEIGQGTYLADTATLTRSVQYSSNGNDLVVLPPNCEVSFVALAADLNGTGLSAEAIAAAEIAATASATAQDALAQIEALSGPIASVFSNAGAELVGTASGLSVEESLQDRVTFASLLSSVGSSIIGFVHSFADAVVRTLQSKLRDVVSPEDFGAVGNGLADDTSALLKAIQSGRRVNGNGRSYGVNGQLTPSSLKSLHNIRLVQIATDTATVYYRMLNLVGLSDFTLRDVELVMSPTITSLFNDDGAGGLYVGGVDKDTYATNFVLDNVRVTGNGCGTGIHIRHAKRFVVSNSQVRDRTSGSSPDPTNDSQNGFEFFNCADFTVNSCQAYNLLTRLSGTATLKWTRGFTFVECRDWVATGCRTVNVDQGFDVSGGYDAVNGYIGNRRWVISGCIANSCRTYGFKFANVTREGLVIGCHAVNTGWLGFVFSPSAALLPTTPVDLTKYNTSNIEVIGCKVTNSLGTSWSNPGSAGGFRIMSNPTYPSWPRGIRFKSCHAEDTQDTPTMTVAFNSDAAAVEYPNDDYNKDIANYLVDCTSRGISNHVSGISTMRAFLTSTTTQSIPNSTPTSLNWDAEADPAGLHSVSTNNNAVYIKTPGTYRLDAMLRFASNATGYRRAYFQVNGVTVNRTTAETGGSASADTTLAFAATTDLKTGDNVIVVVEQNSGGSLTFKGNESRFTVELLN